MTHENNINVSDFSNWSTGLIAFASVVAAVGAILFIITMVWFVTWIYYSWIRRTNSGNYSGGELAKTYLDKYGVNAPRMKFRGTNNGKVTSYYVESKIWYLNPALVNNGTLRLRLLPWTYHRTSIYTLAMAMERTWAVSSAKSNRFNTMWWELSRKVTIFVILIPFILAGVFALGPQFGWNVLGPNSSDVLTIVLSVISFVLMVLFSLSMISFYAKSRKEITANLVGILQPGEIRAINFIYQVKFIYYIVRLIYEVLELILRIMIAVQNKR